MTLSIEKISAICTSIKDESLENLNAEIPLDQNNNPDFNCLIDNTSILLALKGASQEFKKTLLEIIHQSNIASFSPDEWKSWLSYDETPDQNRISTSRPRSLFATEIQKTLAREKESFFLACYSLNVEQAYELLSINNNLAKSMNPEGRSPESLLKLHIRDYLFNKSQIEKLSTEIESLQRNISPNHKSNLEIQAKLESAITLKKDITERNEKIKSEETYKKCHAIQFLLFYYQSTHLKTKMSLLHAAAQYNVTLLVDLLLKNGEDAHQQDTLGKTPLEYARENGALDVEKMLLDHRNTQRTRKRY